MKVINVLPAEYYTDCCISDSMNIPIDKLEEFAKTADKNEEIVLYCAHYECPMSEKAWNMLKKMGFTNVLAYEGGMAEWLQKGYPHTGEAKHDMWKKVFKKRDDFDPAVKTINAEDLKKKMEDCGCF